MPDSKINILSTRPLNELIIQNAKKRNVLIDTRSFIKIHFIQSLETLQQIQLLAEENIPVVFTSKNAVEALNLFDLKEPGWRIYCTENATKEAVIKKFGNERIIATGANAEQIAQRIIEAKESQIVFFCSNQRLDELPDTLRKNSIDVKEVIVYETQETPYKIDKSYDGILFFSPSAVKSFFSENEISNNTSLFAIGGTTAKMISKFSKNMIVQSNYPDAEKLVEKAISYFDKIKQAE